MIDIRHLLYYFYMNPEQSENSETVLRSPEVETELKRSNIPMISNIILTIVLTSFIHLVNFVIFYLLSDIQNRQMMLPAFFVSIIILVLTVVYIFVVYMNYISINYLMIPGSIEKTLLDTIDKIPGKVLAKEGFFYRRKTMLSMNEYDHIQIDKSFMGRIYNYGNISLLQTDELQSTKNYVLTNVENAEEASVQIQRMMDVERSKTTPTQETSN